MEDLIPRIGPYDIWAIKWGYMPVPGANSSDAERNALDQLRANRTASRICARNGGCCGAPTPVRTPRRWVMTIR